MAVYKQQFGEELEPRDCIVAVSHGLSSFFAHDSCMEYNLVSFIEIPAITSGLQVVKGKVHTKIKISP